MRYLKLFLVSLVAVMIFAVPCFGADSSFKQRRFETPDGMDVIEIIATASSVSAGFSATVLGTTDWTSGADTSTEWHINGIVCSCQTDPAPYVWMKSVGGGVWEETTGSSTSYSPTASYDITFTDASSQDIFGGSLADRSQSSTETARPLLDGNYQCVETWGPLTLNISNNSVNSAVILIRIRGFWDYQK